MNPFFIISLITLLLGALIILSSVKQINAANRRQSSDSEPVDENLASTSDEVAEEIMQNETEEAVMPSEAAEAITPSQPAELQTPKRTMDFHSEGELHTRALIGDDNFDKMRQTVEDLLERHVADKCISLDLTSGADSAEGTRRLHSLLPGDSLTLRKNTESGLEMMDVYSGGYRVGRLLLGDAEKAISVMKNTTLTGVYVAEQNCYGDCACVSLRLILFYTPRITTANLHAEDTPYRFTINGPKPIVLYQN